jgi:purine-binding chemotaxis protein CheW
MSANTICFWLGTQQFGAGIEHVKETIELRPITQVFLTPAWVSGIINLRGDIVAVLDLSVFLGMRRTPVSPDTRILLVRGGTKTAGLLVDRLSDARSVDLRTLEAPPPTLPTDGAALLQGVATLEGGAPLMILDLPKLFDAERLKQFARRT